MKQELFTIEIRVLAETPITASVPASVNVLGVLADTTSNSLAMVANSSDAIRINEHKTLQDVRHELVTIVLQQTKGNQSEAARRLGISRPTLARLIDESGMKKPELMRQPRSRAGRPRKTRTAPSTDVPAPLGAPKQATPPSTDVPVKPRRATPANEASYPPFKGLDWDNL